LVEIDGPPPKMIFKHRVFLAPRTDGRYWVGATTDNAFEDDRPTPANRDYLRGRLEEMLSVPFRISDHRAAVRPTVKDRRPMLGRHPEHKNLIIFNGLGTKGASLAPLCSKWLANHLLAAELLPEEVSIVRFPIP
jgi:glycine/D-amino acid oxidase-like deaminating enzyme